jgi:hypothetical protein
MEADIAVGCISQEKSDRVSVRNFPMPPSYFQRKQFFLPASQSRRSLWLFDAERRSTPDESKNKLVGVEEDP